jgi:serine phosphatase RsbU (regulator of sigma subunit)/CBS domain-containing protein
MAPDSESPTGVRVRHVMVRDPISVAPTAPLMDVIQLMSRHRIGAVLVGEKGRADGIFTERDLLRYAAEAPHGWRQRPVSDWMTRELQTISADASWEEAVALMERIHVRHLPVMDHGRVVGLVTARNLIAWRTEHLNRAVDERTHELQRLAEQLLLRDRQSQRDMTVAGRLLNRLLLPKAPPTWPEWSWAIHFRPLDPLGGDYYDFSLPDDNHLGILIADASGHSLPAAMVAIMARIAFAEERQSPRPAEVLGAMNRRLQGLADERFVTAFYGVFDRQSRRLAFANAGHPQPLHYCAATKTCHRLPASGFMLGILSDAKYDEQSIDLASGDRLVFYTDGAIESRNESGQGFGVERLEAVTMAHCESSAEVLRDALVDAVLSFRGAAPKADDCTIVVAACQ